MNLEVNTGDGSITSRRMAWQRQQPHVKSVHRLCRAARERCLWFSYREVSSGAIVMLPTRAVSIHCMDGQMIQNILPYRPYPSDPQWESAMHHRQHARYMRLAALFRLDARRCLEAAHNPYIDAEQSYKFQIAADTYKNHARYYLKAAKQERIPC